MTGKKGPPSIGRESEIFPCAYSKGFTATDDRHGRPLNVPGSSTVDAASSGNEILLLKDNGNDRFTWITQFYVTVVDADGKRTHALPARQRCSVRLESRAWTPRQRSRLPSEGPSKIPTEMAIPNSASTLRIPKADRASQRFTIVANSCCLKGR